VQTDVEGLLNRYGIVLNAGKDNRPVDVLVGEGAKILDRIFQDIAVKIDQKSVTIPISGGMDSRCILAGILKHLPKEQLQTVTVGIPGAMDFEIGQKVARKAGVHNKTINLDHITWNEEELIDYAGKFQYPIALIEGFLFAKVFSFAEKNSVFLSGFMGDPLAGSHLLQSDSQTWNKACKNFVQRNNYTKNQESFQENTLLPKRKLCDKKLICLDEQLDFFIRQRFYIMPLVLLKGYSHIAPFLDPKWIEFMLNLPRPLREGQFLYKKILFHAYPDLFSLPFKNNMGLSLSASSAMIFVKRSWNRAYAKARQYAPFLFRKPSPGLNYIDFEDAYRSKPDLKAIAEKSLQDLQKRNLIDDIDIEKVWRQHQEKAKNYSQLINLLVSLEIFFKSRERKTK